MKKNERLVALNILMALLEYKTSLSHQGAIFSDSSPFTKELCFGFCRHYVRLNQLAQSLMPKKPKSKEVFVIVLMGIYQLHYMNTPDYAVVKEMVALLDVIKKSWAKGLVNAVLREFCRKKETLLLCLGQNEDFVHGQSPVLLKHIKADWPKDWQAIAHGNDAHPPMTLRVNVQKISRDEYLIALKTAGIEAHAHPIAPQGINLEKPCDVYSLPGFSKGWVSVQDGAAQLAAGLLDLKPGQRVLDACSAPGGKTCHLLELEPKLDACIALDVDAKRLKRVSENLERLHLNATLLQGDALSPETWWDNILFDRILLDAPCSAMGVTRRHPDIKLLRTEEDISAIVKVQHAMLRALWQLLAPGGLLVYATCSVISQENEAQIAAFVQEHQDSRCIMPDISWGRPTGHGQQILPAEYGMDGFFYSVLMKEKK